MSYFSNHPDWFRGMKDFKGLGSEILKKKKKVCSYLTQKS